MWDKCHRRLQTLACTDLISGVLMYCQDALSSWMMICWILHKKPKYSASHSPPEHPHHACSSIPLLSGCKGTRMFPKENEKSRNIHFPHDTCFKAVSVTWGTEDLQISTLTQVLETSTSPGGVHSYSSNWAQNTALLSAFSITDTAAAASPLHQQPLGPVTGRVQIFLSTWAQMEGGPRRRVVKLCLNSWEWTSYWDLSQILPTAVPPCFAAVTGYWDAGNITDGNWACEPSPCSDKDNTDYIIPKAAPLWKGLEKCPNVQQQ